jgi:hypothetical protein
MSRENMRDDVLDPHPPHHTVRESFPRASGAMAPLLQKIN